MKALSILYLVLFCFANGLLAQQKNIRLDIGFQTGIPERIFNHKLNDNRNKGMGLHICPKWNYSKNITLGINMEYNYVNGYFTRKTDDPGFYRNLLTREIFSFSPTITYYFTGNKFRPFVSLGAGAYYKRFNHLILNPCISPAVGISAYKVFDLSLEYSRMFGNTNGVANQNSLIKFNPYFFSLKASFSIGLFNSTRMPSPNYSW
jgi:hypothetical protein